MSLKYTKSIDELKRLVEDLGIVGDWTDKGSGQFQFRTPDGAILNWWSSTGTVSFQGSGTARITFEENVSAAIHGIAKPATAPLKREDTDKPRLFVVHGHDFVARDQLELVLRRLDLDPFVLMNTAGGGMTIIEALESHIGRHGTDEFGIVLITPDDVGYAKTDGPEEAKPRARQNVILEMGMLLSSLTRKNVVILVKGFVELPSDATGIIYVHFNEHVKEVVPKLAERLQASGIKLTAEQIARASQ